MSAHAVTARERAFAVALWLSLMGYCLPAAAESLNGLGAGLRTYDYESVMWAVLVSSVGGIGRTVLTLLSKDVIVLSVLRETWKDLVIAALAGMVAYVAIAGFGSYEHMRLPVPMTVTVLFAVGWARGAFFIWSERAGTRIADSAVGYVTNRLGGAISKVEAAVTLPPPDDPDQEDAQ